MKLSPIAMAIALLIVSCGGGGDDTKDTVILAPIDRSVGPQVRP